MDCKNNVWFSHRIFGFSTFSQYVSIEFLIHYYISLQSSHSYLEIMNNAHIASNEFISSNKILLIGIWFHEKRKEKYF